MFFRDNVFFWGYVVTTRGHRHLGALAAAECCLAHARRVGEKNVDWSNDGNTFLWLINEQ